MWPSKQGCSLVVSNILLPVSLVLFLSGLLRPKASNIRENNNEGFDIIRNVDSLEVPSAPVDRVVFLLIDALRSDFVFSNDSAFSYTQELIRSGAAVPFTALAGPPTLTMPRVKAMTTGSSPCFLDMLLNIRDSENRTEAAHTWLDSLKAADQDRKLVFYGSKTWTDLYPWAFDRFQGMDGNYVPDFTLVDDDVVRQIPEELGNDDWSTLVLHLSGLDHVGHVGGPKSPYMQLKQQEMDGLVQQIFEAMETKSHLNRTLLVLAGDHGMDSRGNHGGSLESEMSAALVLMSPQFQSSFPGANSPRTPTSGGYDYHTVIDQTDIVPTLTSLLGIQIPKLSLGVVIPDFLPLWPDVTDQVHQLRRNAAQLMKAYTAYDPSFVMSETHGAEEHCLSLPTPGDQLFCLWGKIEKGLKSNSDEALPDLYAFCRHAQKVMSVPSGDISFSHLWNGIAAALVAIAFTLGADRFWNTPFKLSGLVHSALAVSYCLTMFDIRLIENEHQFWRFASFTYIIIVSISRTLRGTSFWASLLFSGLHFLAQSWNEVGENSSHIARTVQKLLESHTSVLWLLVGVTYLISGVRPQLSIDTAGQSSSGISRWLIRSLSVAALLLKFCLTQAMSPELVSCLPEFLIMVARNVDSTTASRALFTGLAGALLYELLRPKRSDATKQESLAHIVELITLYLLTQSRANNIPLFLIFRLQLEILLTSSEKLSRTQTHALVLLLSQNAYSAFGFTRNISAIDIPNGFNGVTAWSSSPLVPAQICVTLYAGSIWWLLSGQRLIRNSEKSQTNGHITEPKIDDSKKKKSNGSTKLAINTHSSPLEQGGFSSHLAYLTAFQAVGLFRLIGASLLNWNNPSLWTVIAPASLMVVIDIFIHICVSCLFTCVSWWIT